jgi:hypothetical protein
MKNSGNQLILGMMLVALLMASFAWWYRYNQGQRVLSHWGREPSMMMRYAPTLELWKLQPAGESSSETIQIGDRKLEIVERLDITKVPGIVHARQSLVEDASFDWQASGDIVCQPSWPWAFSFVDQDRRTTVAFDFDCDMAQLLGSDRRQVLVKKVTEGLELIISEQNQEEPVR